MDWRPMAYVALRDSKLRGELTEALAADGWVVIAVASGYHLVESMADEILGLRHTSLRPALVVVDAISPGCSGVTIARGFGDLGWSVPVVLVVVSSEESALLDSVEGNDVVVVPAGAAVRRVRDVALARRGAAHPATTTSPTCDDRPRCDGLATSAPNRRSAPRIRRSPRRSSSPTPGCRA